MTRATLYLALAVIYAAVCDLLTARALIPSTSTERAAPVAGTYDEYNADPVTDSLDMTPTQEGR